MDYNSTDGLHSLDNYTAQLTTITDKLIETGAKLLYVATTPFMPNALLHDPIVQQLNERALLVTRAKGIPTVDLWCEIRNAPLWRFFLLFMLKRSYYQDRLGTNINIATAEKRHAFFAGRLSCRSVGQHHTSTAQSARLSPARFITMLRVMSLSPSR
jgi:hypothetical protein